MHIKKKNHFVMVKSLDHVDSGCSFDNSEDLQADFLTRVLRFQSAILQLVNVHIA
jgi:hypothetical protein